MQFPLVFALTGLVQGGVLWWLWRSLQSKVWPATEPLLLTGLMYAALVVPLVIYFTQNVERLPQTARRVAVVLYGLLFAALGSYTAWADGALSLETGVRPADAFAAQALVFVSLGLLCGFDFEARRWRYERLFNYAWRNGILLATAWVMVGVVWLVLYAGAGLMSLIGVKWVMELIRKPVFIFPVSALVVAGAFALGLARAAMTQAIQRFTMSIAAWLLPLVLFFALLWVLAVPFTGLEPLFKTQSAAFTMLLFSALAVLFANCAYQDGEQDVPYPRWLALGTQGAWLALVVVVAIAWWALGLRIAQHGWSEQRLWAGLVATLAAMHALGYALSWRKPQRWMHDLAATNIAAALVLCLGLLVFLSPLGNVRQLGVAAHMQHVLQSRGKLDPDWNYLRWKAGRFGTDVLQAMVAGERVPAGQDWGKQAARLLAQKSRYGHEPEVLSAQQIRDRFPVYPKGRRLPESFFKYAQGKPSDLPWELQRCLAAKASCPVWLGDLNGDGRDELLLFDGAGLSGEVYMPAGDAWRRVGSFSARGVKGKLEPDALEGAKVVTPQWGDVLVQGHRLRLSVSP